MIARELVDHYPECHVDVFESRNHVAGNAWDYIDFSGIRVHHYGPHLFHTNNSNIAEYFKRWCIEEGGGIVPYQHRVKALLADGRYVTLPVNKETAEIVGKENVLDTFFRPYTRKMWGMELEELNPSIIARVPIRDDLNELYFPNDMYQFLPTNGYTKVIEKILQSDRIRVYLNTSITRASSLETEYDHVFNCSPIDKWYDYEHGELGWRSIKFHNHVVALPKILPAPTVNFTHDGPYTRVTEWSQLPNCPKPTKPETWLTFEEPCDYKDNRLERYYPIQDLDGRNRAIYQKYAAIEEPKITFVGRCGRYQYIDMHQAIGQALATVERFVHATD